MAFSPALHVKSCRIPKLSPSWARNYQPHIRICSNFRIAHNSNFQAAQWQSLDWRVYGAKEKKKKKKRFCSVSLGEEGVKVSKKKGTIAGAVALIIGTSIGSGILALPKKTSPAGLLPSSISMTICWAFLVIEALLLVEINVRLLRKRKRIRGEGDELETISMRTMAQETLGEWGGTLATVTYVFLGYTSMIAYSSKSGEIIYHLINLPEPISAIFFTFFFTLLISVGGTQATDQVNQWLTATMLGLLMVIEVLAVVSGGWSGIEGSGDWGKVPATIPVMIFSLVYHDLAPVLCAYLGGDLFRIRTSVLVGSIIPFVMLIIWDAIALGLYNQSDQVADPVELLTRVRWTGVPFMVEAFSLLAVGTSLIGTLLSFSEFFKEQLNYQSLHSTPTTSVEKSDLFSHIRIWLTRNNISLTATLMVVCPSLLVSTTVPEAFSAATDIAGGYCMTMLYGVLPPAMAWAMCKDQGLKTQKTGIFKAAIVGAGLLACGILIE